MADRIDHFDRLDPNALLQAVARIQKADSARMPEDWTGAAGDVAQGLNDLIIASEALGTAWGRVSPVAGKHGETDPSLELVRAPLASPAPVRVP